MAEQDLGLAVLRLTVDARDAEAQLNAFRSLVNRQLSDLGGGVFDGLVKDSKAAGETAGKNLADGIKKATTGLKFESIQEALDFSGALDGTLRDLREYEKALVALREVTRATAPDFGVLNDVIAATSQTIKNYASSTDQLVDAAARVALKEEAQRLRERLQEVRANAQQDREWAGAIRAIEGAQRSAARATEEANRAYRAQLDLVGGIAKKGARDVGGAIGAVGRGVGAAARTAVNVGRTGYSVGAELGIFEEPKSGPLKQAIQQVIDRFKFLGEQATTTRGILLRTFEAAGTAAGLAKIVQNADQFRAALSGITAAAKGADQATSFLANFGDYFAKAGLGSVGPLSGLLKSLAAAEKGGATIVSIGDQLVQLGAGAAGGALNNLEAISKALNGIPPEAQAAVLALAGLSIGFKEKPIVAGINRVLEYLDGLREKSLNARADLQQVLADLEKFQSQTDTAVSNRQPLLPEFRERGLQPLNNAVKQSESLQRISDAIGSNWERGARFLEKSEANLERLVRLGVKERPKQFPGYDAAPLPNPNQYDRPIGPELGKQLTVEKTIGNEQERQRRLHRMAAEEARRRRVELQESAKAAKAEADQAARAAQKEKERAETERRRRRNDAIGSAIIGGAFPALFGQGPGASVGGGLGGFAGGRIGGQFGFGLSLVGTALGAQFDAALQKGVSLANGLDDPIGKFQELRDAALLSSRGLEKQAEALINSGREAEAAALIQADLLKTFGSQQGLDDYRSAIDTLSRSFSQAATVVASFVAGPLAALVKEVSKPSGNLTTAARYEQLVGQLTPDQYRQVDAVKIRATETARRARGGISAFLPPSEGDVTTGRLAGIQEAERLLGVEKQIVLTEQQKQDIANNTNKLRSISYRLIDAEAFGNKQLAAFEQKRQINLERLNKLAALGKDAAPAALEQINSEAALKNYQLTQQTAQEERQKWANSIASANRLADIQGQIAIESRRSGLSDIGLGALRSIEQVRSAIRAEQNAQAALRVKPGDESLINASREAAANTRLAAAKAKQDLLDAFKAAQDSVRSISRGIEDSTLQLLQLKGGNSGLNSFLSGQALYDNQQLAFQQLLPQFLRARELAARDAERFGNPNAAEQFRGLNFSGPVAGVNQRMSDFIQAQRSQERLQQDLYDSNMALVKANASLTEVTKTLNDATLNVYDNITNLTTSIDTLSAKDWSIQVSVAADGSSSAYGDLVNQAVTQ